jgi:hypothetical protein
MRVSKRLAVLFTWFLHALPAPAAPPPTVLEAFSPEGQLKAVRQVTARFSSPMTTFGDPRPPAPFTVDCPAKGAGRWVDGRNWSYDFERDLPGATACRFSLRADLRDLAGQPLAGKRRFSFTTGGPGIVRMQPREGASIDESQVFLLALDAPATAQSIERHAWCRAAGINEKIGVRVLAGEERTRLLEARRDFVDPSRTRKRAGDLPVVALQCRRTLPANTAVALVWGKDVAAPNGIATVEDQELAFRTRPDFHLALHCERTNARAGCVPFRPVRVEFSAPVPVATLGKLVLEESGKGTGATRPLSTTRRRRMAPRRWARNPPRTRRCPRRPGSSTRAAATRSRCRSRGTPPARRMANGRFRPRASWAPTR